MFIAGHQLQKLKACEWTLCVVLQSSFIFFFSIRHDQAQQLISSFHTTNCSKCASSSS